MRQVVLDTNVLVAGVRSRRGASFWILSRLGRDDRFEINVSVPLLLEYEAVLKRPDTCPSLSTDDVDDLLDLICSVAHAREIHFLWRPTLPDPADDMLLELAIQSRGADIITHNVRHFPVARGLGVRAITPAAFLTELRRELT
jgi:putative PIN family toxin of toxin-antitoxin system